MPRSSKKMAALTGVVKSEKLLRLSGASWLSDSALLLVGTHDRALGPITSGCLVRGETVTELRVKCSERSGDDESRTQAPVQWLAVAHGQGCLRGGSDFGLTFAIADGKCQLDPGSVALALTDLRTLIRNHFTALSSDERSVVVEFIASSAKDADNEASNRLRLSRSLNLVREMLRERLPICELSPSRIEGLAVEAVMALDDESFYVEGWLCDGESEAIRMTAVSPEGNRTELLGSLFRYRRPDADEFFKSAIGDQHITKYGFIAYFHASAPSLLPTGWVIEVETAAGTAMETLAPQVITADARIRTELFNDLAHDGHKQELRRHHISPALSALQLRRSRRIGIDNEVLLGEQPASPQVSILVPLYGRLDLLEHQMAQFADDPELHRAELIYVLDSPELKADLLSMAEGLFRLYRLPFRIIVLSENAGFSTANNIAASRARGQLLLLLNSDVLPNEPGWLSKLTDFYTTLEKPGSVGPKLIYEDNSLQHAGLYFEQVPGSEMWTNEHYYKGLHGSLPAANLARSVPAVTGACLMIDASLFASIGGFSGIFIQGDYEDSDLCLRLSGAGHSNWYYPDVVLYHLEGQSYPKPARQLYYEYNRWLFNEMWSGTIRAANSDTRLAASAAPQSDRLAAGSLNHNGVSGGSVTTHTQPPKAPTGRVGIKSAEKK